MAKKFSSSVQYRFWMLLSGTALALLVAELFLPSASPFGIAATPFFHAWYGLVSCVGLVLMALFLGLFLKKPEDKPSKDARL